MLNVHVGNQLAGSLFKPESEPDRHHFRYKANCPQQDAVSLSMPVSLEHYASDYRTLHPIFDMNLPEGALADRLRRDFSKVIPNFDSMALLKLVGKSQIGRLRFAAQGETLPEVPAENVQNLLTHDGAEGLFEELLAKHAVHSGISGAMPKVLVRDSATLGRVTHRGATHILKAWTDEYQSLAENEYFCMRAALHAGLDTPGLALSKGGKFLVVERFDLQKGTYLGFEDFCVLNAKTASQKYDGSYEGISKRIKEFVSPEYLRNALEDFFKSLLLSCVLRNGDAHLKNFGVLYNDTESAVKLSPTYDIVTTTAYNRSDILALTLSGTKRWPTAKVLTSFARTHCNIQNGRIHRLFEEVVAGVLQAKRELAEYLQRTPAFSDMGKVMQEEWEKGLKQTAPAYFST